MNYSVFLVSKHSFIKIKLTEPKIRNLINPVLNNNLLSHRDATKRGIRKNVITLII